MRTDTAHSFKSRAWSTDDLSAGLAHILTDGRLELPDDLEQLKDSDFLSHPRVAQYKHIFVSIINPKQRADSTVWQQVLRFMCSEYIMGLYCTYLVSPHIHLIFCYFVCLQEIEQTLADLEARQSADWISVTKLESFLLRTCHICRNVKIMYCNSGFW